MPIKDPEQRKAAQKRAMDKLRGVNPDVNPESVNPPGEPDVTQPGPEVREDWLAVHAYIQRPQVGRMSQLERIQRIAGGKHSEHIRFGINGPTLEEIGSIISVLPPLITRS